MSANGKGLNSPKGKKFVNIAYCVGAAIVIVGALMKLMHWPGWEIFLPLGMLTEALLFLLGSFEEPHHEGSKWDWSTVYPQLTKELSPADMLQLNKEAKKSGKSVEELSSNKNVSVKSSQVSVVNSSTSQGTVSAPSASGLSEADMKKWNDSISKISETADNIGKLSEIGKVSNSYLDKLDAAGNAVESLAKVQSKSASDIKASTDLLVVNYNKTSDALQNHEEVFKNSGDATKDGINNVSKNLSAINSVYEMHLNLVNKEVKAKEAQGQMQGSINDQLELIHKAITQSATSTNTFAKEGKKLADTVVELNSVYGNMLTSLK